MVKGGERVNERVNERVERAGEWHDRVCMKGLRGESERCGKESDKFVRGCVS